MLIKKAAMYVYILEYEDRPGVLKVGRTKDPRRRLAAYRTGSHAAAAFAHIRPCIDACQAERRVHEMLDAHREVGEWFRVGLGTAIRAVDVVAETQNVEVLGEMARKTDALLDRERLCAMAEFEDERDDRLAVADLTRVPAAEVPMDASSRWMRELELHIQFADEMVTASPKDKLHPHEVLGALRKWQRVHYPHWRPPDLAYVERVFTAIWGAPTRRDPIMQPAWHGRRLKTVDEQKANGVVIV